MELSALVRQTGDGKTLRLYDISDDLSIDGKLNFTLRHMRERISIYKEQMFNFKIDRIKL